MIDLAPTTPAAPSPAIRKSSTRALTLAAPALGQELIRMLRQLAIEVELVTCPGDFTTRITTLSPDLLVVDFDAPGVRAEILRAARAPRRTTPVIGLACYWSEREDAARQLADALVHKPPRMQEWVTQLRRLGITTAAA